MAGRYEIIGVRIGAPHAHTDPFASLGLTATVSSLLPMSEPEYLICLQCETPTYQFEYDVDKEKVISAICNTCGADDLTDFVTESELEEEQS